MNAHETDIHPKYDFVRFSLMKSAAIAYLSTGLVMLVLDSIWLKLAADGLYRANIGALMRSEFSLTPAIIFYLIYVLGITVFVVIPTLNESGPWQPMMRGALLGLVAYATYDLTNQATLKNWSTMVTVADLSWGTLLTAVAATAGWFATRHLAAPI